jgi:hypothetical protein
MEFGTSCWMKNSFTHTRMRSISNTMMGLVSVFFLGYSHIQQMIQKSKPSFIFNFMTMFTDHYYRVLLATICDKRICPCPRCLTPKSQSNCIGYLHDLSQRVKQLCTYLTEKVTQACNSMFTCGTPIKGDLVESIPKPFSSVPTVASLIFSMMHIVAISFC